MATHLALRRMKRELDLLSRGSAAPGISAWPRDPDSAGARLDLLDAEIVGASDTPYEGGVFRLQINIPSEYPMKPPHVRFLTRIYHPNIDTQGRICLDTLSMPPKGAWKPALNIATLLTTIQALMSSPNPDDGLMVDITDEFRRNPALFRSKARDYTRRYAIPNNTAPASTNAVLPSDETPTHADPHTQGQTLNQSVQPSNSHAGSSHVSHVLSHTSLEVDSTPQAASSSTRSNRRTPKNPQPIPDTDDEDDDGDCDDGDDEIQPVSSHCLKKKPRLR